MRRIFTLSIIALLFVSLNSNGQSTTCTSLSAATCSEVVEDFNASNGGFTGTGFIYSSANGNFTNPVANGNVSSTITTRSFTKIGQQNTIQAGFDFSKQGNNITINSITVEVLNSSNAVIASCSLTVPTGSTGTVCFSLFDTDIVDGASIKLRFSFVTTSSSNRFITFDNFRQAGSNITLPVKFTGLDAKKSGNGTLVTWNVADETDVAHYEVEKSTNGRNYSTIGSVKASGRSSYSFTDASVTPVSFYRIKSVDIDGKVGYSTFISLKNGKSVVVLRAYPTVVQTTLTVQHATTTNTSRIFISSEDGRLVKSIIPATGSMETPVNLFNLKAGLYILRFEDGNGNTETMKFLKN